VDAAHLAGWVLIAGAVIFGVGAANPYLARAWTAPEPAFLAIVAAHPRSWRVTNLLFLAATILTAAGLAALPPLLADGAPRVLALAGAVSFAMAGLLWMVCVIYRLAVVPATATRFVEKAEVDPWVGTFDRLSGGLFKTFIVAGFAGLAAIGIAATAGGPIPAPLGWGSAALSALLVGGLALTGDMPPFTVYIAPLAFGIALVTAG
jgi:hypothetical protein